MNAFQVKMQARQALLRTKRRGNLSGAKLAVKVRQARTKIVNNQALPDSVVNAISENFDDWTIKDLSPAQKAAFSRRAYDKYLGYYG